MKVYLGGSLREGRVQGMAKVLRTIPGIHVFDDWSSAHPEADDKWRDYEKDRSHSIEQALEGNTANQIFNFDRLNILASDVFVLVLPCGKSGHLEAGFMAGLREAGYGKKVYAYIGADPERYDIMSRFFDGVFSSCDELYEHIEKDKNVYYMYGRL